MKTTNSMPPCQRRVAFCTPWRSISDAPTSDSDTTTVMIEASVMVKLRARLEVVSRTT